MAFKPSERRSIKIESTELDLRPIMNMMCILIPLLLSCSQFVKSTYIELNLPTSGGSSSSQSPDDKEPPKEKPKIGLKLVVTEKGFTIAGNSIVLSGAEGGGPTLPKINGKYDFDGLDKKLKDIVKTITGKGFEDERTLILTAEDAIEYQSIASAMDIITACATKKFTDEATKASILQPWFGQIGFGKIILN